MQNQDDGHESKLACDPTLSVDRDKKTRLERLELVGQGLSKLRAQPWLTVRKCSVAFEWNRPTQHKRCGPRERCDVDSCRHPVCV